MTIRPPWLLLPLFAFAGCAPMRPAPAPRCRPGVGPISGERLSVSIPVNFNYTPKDQSESALALRRLALDHLNTLGLSQSNTFELQNGSTLNFEYAFTINNNNETFTGTLVLHGWGWGYLHTYYTSGVYNDPDKMITDLLDQAYEYIKLGWHDTTANCVP